MIIAMLLLIPTHTRHTHYDDDDDDDDDAYQVFEDEASMYKLEDVKLEHLGRVAEVTVTKDDCLLMKVMPSTFCEMLVNSLLLEFNSQHLLCKHYCNTTRKFTVYRCFNWGC